MGEFMSNLFTAAATAGIILLSVSPTLASDAFIATTSKEVSFSTGGGYTRVPLLESVRAGTQVMANDTGSGWIIYCGCDVEIKPGRVYTVENRECKVESVDLRRSGLPHIVKYPDGQRGEQELKRCRVGAWWLLAPAAVVGVCAAAGCFDDDNDKRIRKALPATSP
jgi:hypothetical protein